MTAAVGELAEKQAAQKAAKVIVKKGGKTAGARAGKIGRKQASGQKVLLMEFVVCMVILGLHPLVSDEGPALWMKKGSALALLFFILGMVGAIGPKANRTAYGFGAIVTVGLLVDQRSIFGLMASKFGGNATGNQKAVAAGAQSAAMGGVPVPLSTSTGPQTVTVIPDGHGGQIVGNSADF